MREAFLRAISAHKGVMDVIETVTGIHVSWVGPPAREIPWNSLRAEA